MTDTIHPRAVAPETALDHGGRAAWGAIFAGTVVALGTFILLSLLGLGIGFAALEPDANNPIGAVPTATPIWTFVSQLVALFAGGYTAGRFAGVLHSVGAMLHGATVWALTTIAAVWLATSAAIGLVNVASSAVSTAASGVANATEAVIPDDMSLPNIAVSNLSMEDIPEPVRSRMREAGITPDNFRAEMREAFRSVISVSEQRRITDSLGSTATDIMQDPSETVDEVDDLISNLFGRGDVLSEEDYDEAVDVMVTRFGVTEAEAEAFIDRGQERLAELQTEAQQTLEEAQAAALEAADAAADAAATAGFLAFFASLLGLIAAGAGAMVGRPTRI